MTAIILWIYIGLSMVVEPMGTVGAGSRDLIPARSMILISPVLVFFLGFPFRNNDLFMNHASMSITTLIAQNPG